MKIILGMALAFSFALATVNMSFAQQRAVSVEQDKAEIRKTLSDEAQAVTDFPRTHDVEGNLRFYAKEFFEIRDGKIETLDDMKQNLKMILDQLRLDNSIEFFVQYSNISVDVNGSVGWATYDMMLKYGSRGTLTTTLNKKCTSIFKRSNSSWLFVHDHCSMPKETHSATPRLDNN